MERVQPDGFTFFFGDFMGMKQGNNNTVIRFLTVLNKLIKEFLVYSSPIFLGVEWNLKKFKKPAVRIHGVERHSRSEHITLSVVGAVG